jgi:Tol biopolymer transport system component
LNSFTQPASDCSYPRWSPKGDFISYTTAVNNTTKQHYIQLINWYGKDIQQITDPLLDLRDACWSPTAGKIAFIGNSRDSSYLFVSQKDGRNREILFKSNQSINSPDWSPDGSSIIFTIRKNENQQNIFQLLLY